MEGAKVAVISGGAGGIGRAVAARLAADFFPVILDRDEAAGRAAMAELSGRGRPAEFFALDLARKPAVRETFDAILSRRGRIDLLVNLAGGTLHAKLLQDFPPREWREVIDANLKATFLACQAAIGPMKRQGGGVIVNTASNYAVTGSATRTAYSAAKAAIIAFTKSLAAELAPHGIRANVIAPGRTSTPRVMGHYTAEAWAEKGREIPMGRTAEPAEIAAGVAFLASDASAYMTGQTLHVNGGMVMP